MYIVVLDEVNLKVLKKLLTTKMNEIRFWQLATHLIVRDDEYARVKEVFERVNQARGT